MHILTRSCIRVCAYLDTIVRGRRDKIKPKKKKQNENERSSLVLVFFPAFFHSFLPFFLLSFPNLAAAAVTEFHVFKHAFLAKVMC